MKINYKELNKKKCFLALIVVFIIILIVIGFHKDNYGDLTVILDNETIQLINNPLVDENGNIFMSIDDIKSLFDSTIYYNEINEELITTCDKHIAFLKLGEAIIEINDAQVEINGTLKMENDILYLPVSDLAEVYDLEMYYATKSNRIIIDSLNREKIEVIVRQRTGLKKGKSFLSGRIETLIIGDKLVVLEESGSYKKVRSPLGNIGYVKNKKISEEERIRSDVTYEKLELVPYFNYSNSSGIYDNIDVDGTKRNVVLPEFFVLEKEGKLLDKTNITTATYSVYQKWAETNRLEILPTFINDANVSDTLLTYEQRSKIINELKQKILDYNYFGMNISFKTIDDFNSFYRLIIELTPRFHAEGLKVIVTINNNNLERQRLEKVVDCIIEE